MLVILVGMVVAASLGYVYRSDIDQKVHDGISNGMNQYDNSTSLHDGIDFMQKEVCYGPLCTKKVLYMYIYVFGLF